MGEVELSIFRQPGTLTSPGPATAISKLTLCGYIKSYSESSTKKMETKINRYSKLGT